MATTLCCVLSQQLVAILREFTQTKNTNLTACMGRIHLKVSQNIPDTFLPLVVGLCPGWKAKERFARTCSRPWSKGDAHTSRIGLELCGLADFQIFSKLPQPLKHTLSQIFQSTSAARRLYTTILLSTYKYYWCA